jgi:hypothetical protein
MGFTALTAAYKLAFQLSPVVFTGGIAGQITGGMLPIIAITQAVNLLTGLLSGTENIELDDFFAHFEPLPGSTLFECQIGSYPLANQVVAANATITQPLNLSVLMRCPARDILGLPLKLGVMTLLQSTIAQHNQMGGTYTICTPAFIYTNGILLSMRDASPGLGVTHQVQDAYQLDFTFPLLTVQNAQGVQSSLMSKLTGGTQISGQPAWSGAANTVGNPSSLQTASLVPTAAQLPAANTTPGGLLGSD